MTTEARPADGVGSALPEAARTAAAPAAAPPAGLGIAVVFDWALAVQLASQGAAAALQHGTAAGVGGRIAAAAILVLLGEVLRRGRRAAWVLQLGLLALVTYGGLRAVPGLLHGHVGRASILSVLIELTYAPWLLWRLLLPRSVRGFGVAGRRRSARTSGRWLPVMVTWSVVWGIAVAVSQAL